MKKKTSQPHYASISSYGFMILSALFIAVMTVSNLLAIVPVSIGFIRTDGAFYVFPLAYVLGDVISEVYGFFAARAVVLTGFCALLIINACFFLTLHLPHGSFDITSFKSVVGNSPQLLLAGLSGYLVGEILNALTMTRMKRRTGEKKLWLRLTLATLVSEIFDTTLFCTIAAPVLGYTSLSEFTNYTFFGILWKSIVEILIMPGTYLVCAFVKKQEPSYFR